MRRFMISGNAHRLFQENIMQAGWQIISAAWKGLTIERAPAIITIHFAWEQIAGVSQTG